LKNIDFSDGEYVLIINDGKLNKSGKRNRYWIDDEKVLEKYRDSIRITPVSMSKWIPAGFDNRFVAFELLKNRKVIKRAKALPLKLQYYTYGNILEKALPLDSVVENISFLGTKEDILKKFNFKKMQADDSIYKLELPVFDTITTPFNYHFTVEFPSVAVPVHFENKDTDPYWRSRPIVSNGFDKDAFGKELYAKVQQNIITYTGQLRESTNKNAHQGSISQVNIFNTSSTDADIKNSDNRLIYISEFMLEHYELTFWSDKEFYEQIKQHDFSQYITEEITNKEALISLAKEKIKKAKPPIEFKNVGFSSFRDELKTSGGFSERIYEVAYWHK
ncbi:MAG TPA: hypothetical protein DDZ39_00600, partial [Flavobacteriaceae bacterium]|nr:hypothetical protein [Flavobacteriaceae bacterium]